jgi:hypothetical protein
MSLNDSIRRVEGLLVFARLMGVFEECFPRDFRRLRVSPFAGEGEQVRACDALLCCLSRRFPVCGDAYYMVECLQEGSDPAVPVYPMGLDLGNDDLGDFGLAYRAVAAAAKDDFGDAVMRPLVGSPAGCYPTLGAVRRACHGERSPLKYLPDVYAYVTQSTDNFWLDVTEEMYHSGCEAPDFTAQQVKALADEWALARAVLRRCRRLNDWMERDAVKRARAAGDLIRRAARLDAAGRAWVSATPGALVNVLAVGGQLEGEDEEEGFAYRF